MSSGLIIIQIPTCPRQMLTEESKGIDYLLLNFNEFSLYPFASYSLSQVFILKIRKWPIDPDETSLG